MKIKLLSLIILAGVFIFGIQIGLAEDGGDNLFSNSIIEKSVAAGGTAGIKVQISNEDDEAATYETFLKAVKPVGNQGSIEFSESTSEELVSWVEFSEPEFTVEPNETKEMTYTISVPEDATSGGHYAVILAKSKKGTILNEEEEQILAMLMINVTGDLKYEGEIVKFVSNKPSYKPGEQIEFIIDFENQGNVHIKPQGHVEIFKGNTKIDEISINPEGVFVFPKVSRNFNVTWRQGANFGKYTATANLSFGGTEEISSLPISFWVVNWFTIIIVLGIVLVAILLIILLTRKKKDKKSGKQRKK